RGGPPGSVAAWPGKRRGRRGPRRAPAPAAARAGWRGRHRRARRGRRGTTPIASRWVWPDPHAAGRSRGRGRGPARTTRVRQGATLGAVVGELAAAQEELVGSGAGARAADGHLFAGAEDAAQRLGHAAGDLVLDGEDVCKRAVVALTPAL